MKVTMINKTSFIVSIVFLGLALLCLAASVTAREDSVPEIIFSHLYHIEDMGIECIVCHEDVEESKKYSEGEKTVSLSQYDLKSEYQSVSEYKTKSDYDTTFVILENNVREDLIWNSNSENLNPQAFLTSM